ncbi:hypothetical protein DL768_008760 [Monosporascus sp. mg162]|nr:hypothetical protein DL768_008760 [Monosporascus sp. mg162]
MSSIERLRILGVRSFSPVTAENIRFFTPLTLIVGYNGSGKTTIIECLKYATTSELPPNSTKGGAFIHDPKLCGEHDVLAQVKLGYKIPPNTTRVITRSVQLTVKKNTRTQKTLEGSLQTTMEGENTSISTQKAKLDELVLKDLGVPKAILEFVIFCHQDESLWPMSEPSVLKKRFDEIFEAMKYTKAIDNLKVLRKKQGEKLRGLRDQEVRDKADKERADRCADRMESLQAEITAMRLKCKELRKQMDEAERKARELHEQATSYLGIVNDLENKKQLLGYRREALEETRSRMDELTEPDGWLQDTLAQYEERVERLRRDYEENVAQYSEYQKELARLRDDLSSRLAEQGKLQSDKEKYERQLEARVELIHQEARIHGVRGFDGDLDDRQIQSFNDRMQKLLVDKKRELERLQGENAEDLEKKAGVITELEGRKARYIQDRVSAVQQNATLEKRIVSARQLLNAVDVDEGAKAVLDSSFKGIEQRLQTAVEEFQGADFDTIIQDENDQLQQLENESSRLARELVESSRLARSRGELDFHKKKISQKKQELDALCSSSESDKISRLIGSSWEPATVERQFQQALQAKTEAYEEARRRQTEIIQDLKLVQGKLSSAKTRAKEKEGEMERRKSTVLNALKASDPKSDPNVADLPDAIAQLEEDILEEKKEIALTGALTSYYEECQKTLDKHNKCELCHRPFVNASEKSVILRKIRKVLEEHNEAQAQADIASMERLLGTLRAARPDGEVYEQLLKEKPAQDKEIREIQEEESRVLRRLEDADEDVRQKQEERQEVESMTKIVGDIARTHREIEESTAVVDRLMSQQQSSSGMVRNDDEINELQDACKEKIRVTTARIAKFSNLRQQKRDEIKDLELERSELKNKISEAVRLLERKRDLETQILTHKDDMASQKEIIQQADKDLESIEPQIAKARTIRDETLQRGRAKEKKVADERDTLASSVNQLKAIDGDIQAYVDGGGPSRLVSNEKAIQNLKKDISGIETDMNDLTARTNKLKEEINNSSGNRKNIVDNLNYRKTLREIEKLEQDVEDLESRNANEDYDRLAAEAREFETQRDQLNAERSSIIGTRRAKEDEHAIMIAEWDTQYHDAARKYRETHIKVETTKAAVEDLGKYGEALNNAIMKYHALKMEEVNRIAGELWRETYQGTDIDTIMIKSDSETATGRQTYNYRVCMVKQDTEMDMRGRCSAGQKVLASIIIRLALAESFGVGCGLIALDEPTTNLDRDNIRSLAESLHGIIKARRVQRNFQLIVITHDEEFLRHMRCSDFCDYFYRVKRDDKQNSVISKELISTIM